MGGKARIARRLAEIIRARETSESIWEPFCGGAWMTRELAKAFRVHASDAHPGLIQLYLDAQEGLFPEGPCQISLEEWTAAKALSPRDPWAAFVGFGCSFNGDYFSSPALGRNGKRLYSDIAADHVRAIGRLPVRFSVGSFFDRAPEPGVLMYLDPPYAGSKGYSTGPFDSALFYARCAEWSRAGATLYVSEYSFPLGECVWERTARATMGAGRHGGGPERTERLYRVAPWT